MSFSLVPPILCRNMGFMKFRKKKATSIKPNLQSLTPTEILRNNYRDCSWPNIYYDRLQGLIDMLEPKVMVEVGVAYGYHAVDLLSRNPSLVYFGIDPYRADYDPSDSFSKDVESMFGLSGQNSMDILFQTVESNLKRDFLDRANIIRDTSENIVNEFENESVDLVFIDGDHRFEPVLKDLESWWPKVKRNGVILGDDWDWKGVREAAIHFANMNEMKIILLNEINNDHTIFMMVKNNE
jgi:predicted O-methyltransferase YrrM